MSESKDTTEEKRQCLGRAYTALKTSSKAFQIWLRVPSHLTLKPVYDKLSQTLSNPQKDSAIDKADFSEVNKWHEWFITDTDKLNDAINKLRKDMRPHDRLTQWLTGCTCPSGQTPGDVTAVNDPRRKLTESECLQYMAFLQEHFDAPTVSAYQTLETMGSSLTDYTEWIQRGKPDNSWPATSVQMLHSTTINAMSSFGNRVERSLREQYEEAGKDGKSLDLAKYPTENSRTTAFPHCVCRRQVFRLPRWNDFQKWTKEMSDHYAKEGKQGSVVETTTSYFVQPSSIQVLDDEEEKHRKKIGDVDEKEEVEDDWEAAADNMERNG